MGARALTGVTAVKVPYPKLRGVLAGAPEYCRQFGLLELDHFRDAMGLAADLMTRDSRKRAAAILLRLAGQQSLDPPPEAEIHLTQEEVSGITNLSRGSLSALLRAFEAEGTIAVSYGCIRILWPERLVRVVTGRTD